MSAVNTTEWAPLRTFRRRAHWPVLLSLLPAAALAVFAWMSLQADRRWVENDARERAQAALQRTTAALTNALARNLEIFRLAAVTWPPGAEWGATNPSPQLARFQQRFPGLSISNLTPPTVLLAKNGSLQQPPAYDPAPFAPRWFRDLSTNGTSGWARLLNAFDEHDTNGFAAAAASVHDAGASAEMEKTISLLQRAMAKALSPASQLEILESMHYPSDITPGGLPFSAHLYATWCRLQSSQPLVFAERSVLSNLVWRVPSALTPFFLESARRRAGTSAERAAVDQLRAAWEADERRRAVAAAWWDSDRTMNAAPRWLAVGAERWLVGARFTEVSAPLPAIALDLLPDWLLVRILRDELEILSPTLPVGLSLDVSLAGQKLTGETNPPPRPAVMALVDMLVATGSSALPPTRLEVAALLTDPEALFARTRQRQRRFGALVGLSLIIAALGAWLSARAIRRQEALAEQRGNFVAAVSHELRAPIASVRLLAENLERGTVQTESKRHEYYGLICRETRRLSQLIANVLDFGRLERGQVTYLPAPADLRAIVIETLAVMQPQAVERDVALKLELPESSVSTSLVADAPALQRALINLLDNALKHSAPGTVVTVTLSADQGPPRAFQVSVADQGPGIPAEDHARIFEPFQRLGSELRRETPGVGLGLALARHIAQGHGGSVAVESNVGAGSTFRLRLPDDVPR